MSVKNNITKFQTELAPFHARLVAVSKTHPVPALKEAYDAGQRIFGENKVQEMTDKQPLLPADVEWHMIGHLQRNKVKYIAPFVSLIHGVDSLRLLEEINKQAERCGRVIPCLLQIYIAREETKFGLDAEEAVALLTAEALRGMTNVRIEGLMGMASFTDRTDQIRGEFRSLKQYFDQWRLLPLPKQVDLHELSMGMSGDYQIALEEGSTLVRIGTSIFGERTYSNQSAT